MANIQERYDNRMLVRAIISKYEERRACGWPLNDSDTEDAMCAIVEKRDRSRDRKKAAARAKRKKEG
jgi:hypothetical protein